MRNEAIGRDRRHRGCHTSAANHDQWRYRMPALRPPVPSCRRAAWNDVLAPAVAALWTWTVCCVERGRQRRALAQLDDRLLRDIGIAPLDVGRESRKWFWQP
jgi:uncharacterized protein YjiS (DUF1127 family)